MAKKDVAKVFKDIDLKEVAATTSLTEKRIREIVEGGADMEATEAIILADYAKIDAGDLLAFQTDRTLKKLKYSAPPQEREGSSTTQPRSQSGSSRAMKSPGQSEF